MSCGDVLGLELCPDSLVLTKHRDFKWAFDFVDEAGVAQPFPPGQLFFELYTSPVVTRWPFTIVGAHASLKVESGDVGKVPARTRWQLVWLPVGEVDGGDPVARGTVKVQE